MAITRRNFQRLLSTLLAYPLIQNCKADNRANINPSSADNENIVLSTWNNRNANQAAIDALSDNSKDLLSAIEKGINTVEADPNDMSVGYGGRPDREGNVTLDACMMDDKGNAGAVTYLQGYMHPISVAKKVLTDTPHVILSGIGAAQFAHNQGFKKVDLMTEESTKQYKKWLEKSEYIPEVNIERHDTIGMIARNKAGNLSGGCSTSGLAYKMAGRVGDSPIIGAGLYVDNEFGCATATGLGEIVLENCTTFLIVELLRQGYSVQKACEESINRIVKRRNTDNVQVGVIAMDSMGNTGAYSIQKGFNYVKSVGQNTTLIEADSYYS
jgi:N4-(beta-N-acetylglucosaminyl)-L-asparaginase